MTNFLTTKNLKRGVWGVGLGVVLACGHPSSKTQAPAPTAPLPTAGMSGQQVGILPITLIGAEDTLHWDTVVGEREKADSVLTALLKARAPEVGWVGPEELRRSARRAPGIATDPEQMATPLLRNPSMVIVLDPLRSQLRTLAAIAVTRYSFRAREALRSVARFLYCTKPHSSAMPHASSTTPPNDSISLLRSDSDGAMLRTGTR